jgi:hypothetical protein
VQKPLKALRGGIGWNILGGGEKENKGQQDAPERDKHPLSSICSVAKAIRNEDVAQVLKLFLCCHYLFVAHCSTPEPVSDILMSWATGRAPHYLKAFCRMCNILDHRGLMLSSLSF